MEDFIIIDPTVELNSATDLNSKLISRNSLLTITLIISLCATGYFAYMYYQSLEDYA